MSKKFRCIRLLLTKDGRIKKLNLENGGGTRSCEWPDDQMTFDELIKKHQTSLYDFQHQPLDVKQFKTFADYISNMV